MLPIGISKGRRGDPFGCNSWEQIEMPTKNQNECCQEELGGSDSEAEVNVFYERVRIKIMKLLKAL